jgi:hypothetical protein
MENSAGWTVRWSEQLCIVLQLRNLKITELVVASPTTKGEINGRERNRGDGGGKNRSAGCEGEVAHTQILLRCGGRSQQKIEFLGD